jgi:DNA repair protein RadC
MINIEKNCFKLAEIEVKYSTSVKPAERLKVVTSCDAAEAFRELWSQSMEYKESFYAMYLNRNNKVLGIHRVAEGGLSGTLIDVRCVFQVALKEAGKFLDIPLLDHLIMLPDEGYTSFADEGLM